MNQLADAPTYWRIPAFYLQPSAVRARQLRSFFTAVAKSTWDQAAAALQYVNLREMRLPIDIDERAMPAVAPRFTIGTTVSVLLNLSLTPKLTGDILVAGSSELWFTLAFFAHHSRPVLYSDTNQEREQSSSVARGMLREISKHWPAIQDLQPRLSVFVPMMARWPYWGLATIELHRTAGMDHATCTLMLESPMETAIEISHAWLSQHGMT